MSRWEMEVHIMPRCYWRTIQRGWLVVPPAQSRLDFFVDAMTDSLHDFSFDDVALGVDRHLDHDIANQVTGKLGAVYRRIGIYGRIGDVDFMARDRSIDKGSQGRSGVRVVIAGICVGYHRLRLWQGLLRPRRREWFFSSEREYQPDCVGRIFAANIRWK